MILVKSGAKIKRRRRNSLSSTSSERSNESESDSPEIVQKTLYPPAKEEKPSILTQFFQTLWSILSLIPFEEIANLLVSLLGCQTWKETPSWKESSKHVYDDRCTYSGYVMQKAAIRGSYAYVEDVWASMDKSQRNMAKLFNNQHFWESSENLFAEDEDDTICHGCRFQTIDTMLMDCGHTVLCTTCAKLCTHCPICLKGVRRSPRKIDLDHVHKYDYTRSTPEQRQPLRKQWSIYPD